VSGTSINFWSFGKLVLLSKLVKLIAVYWARCHRKFCQGTAANGTESFVRNFENIPCGWVDDLGKPLESENRPILVHPHGSLWKPLQAILGVRSHYPPGTPAIGPSRGDSGPLPGMRYIVFCAGAGVGVDFER
jgi:hypothetical protein